MLRVVSLTILSLILLASIANAQTTFRFGLYEGQENPGTGSLALGEGVGVLSADETTFDITVTHDVANVTAAHIHIGDPGSNGGIVFNLGSPVSPIIAQWNPTPAQVADLTAGRLYVNVHSVAFASGEIRGQIIQECRDSTVGAGIGGSENILFINGSTGGDDHVIDVDSVTEPFFWGTVLKPSAGGNGRYVVHGNLGTPPGSIHVLPASIGRTCFPFLLSDGATPSIIANNVGKESAVGASTYFGSPTSDPAPAPSVFLQAVFPDVNLSPGTTITFQGVALDPDSASPKNASATNAVIARIL